MHDSITRGISIQVESQYLPNHSRPEENAYFFAYHVTIKNNSDRPVQLVSRHWIIMNADGKKNEVRGEGVVGQQPILAPASSFRYSSFCPLNTPVGSMHGTYQMMTEDNEVFNAVIAPFTLAIPGMLQ